MTDENVPLSARGNGAASPKHRARSNWQRASFSATRPRSSSGGRPSVSARGYRTSASQQSQEKDGETEVDKAEDQETVKSRTALECELETMKGCYEQANKRVQELESRAGELSRKNRYATAELEQTNERLHDMERENSILHRKLTSVSSNLDTTKNRLTNMEWKAMEYEKLSILNDNLKTKNENLRQDNRDLERRLQQTEKELEEIKRQLELKQEELETTDERMKDLRLQVKEEAIKNMHLDKEVEELQSIRNSSKEKDEQVAQLSRKLQETELLLEHARKSWKAEREKVTGYQNEDRTNDEIRTEADIVKAENMTLKKLIIAKDQILIQKTRTLDNIKNRLAQCTNQFIEVEVLYRILESKPTIKASFPVGHKLKQEMFGDGEVQINGWMEDTQHSRHTATSSRRAFFDTILQDDDSRNNNTRLASPRRPKTAIVKPNNYKVRSFDDFRSCSDGFQESLTQKDSNKENDKTTKSGPPKVHRGQLKGEKSNVNSKAKCTENERSKLRRTKSAENKLYHDPPEGPFFRPSSPGAWSSTRTSSVSVSTVGSSGSASVPAIMFKAAPEKDRAYSRVVHIGDRIYVDMSRSKEKRKHNFRQAVVKFIGNLDKEYDCYRIYMGIKLDEPVGDTDGIYKGKRYFRVTENHGKFVRITRVTAIYNRETNRFQDVEDILGKRDDTNSDKTPVESQENFQLKL